MVDLEFLAEDGDIFVLRGEFVELESEFVDEDGEERLLGEDSHAVNISVLKVETEADAAKGVFLVHQIVVLEQDILAVVIGEVVDDALDQILALLAIKLKKYGCHRALHDHSLLNFAHCTVVTLPHPHTANVPAVASINVRLHSKKKKKFRNVFFFSLLNKMSQRWLHTGGYPYLR